jgi:hypothetical protein
MVGRVRFSRPVTFDPLCLLHSRDLVKEEMQCHALLQKITVWDMAADSCANAASQEQVQACKQSNYANKQASQLPGVLIRGHLLPQHSANKTLLCLNIT